MEFQLSLSHTYNFFLDFTADKILRLWIQWYIMLLLMTRLYLPIKIQSYHVWGWSHSFVSSNSMCATAVVFLCKTIFQICFIKNCIQNGYQGAKRIFTGWRYIFSEYKTQLLLAGFEILSLFKPFLKKH